MRRDRRAGLALLLAALAGCAEPTRAADGPGYDPALPTGEIYRWALGRTVRVFVDTTAAPAGLALRETAGRALASWRRALQYRELSLELTNDPAAADVLVRLAAAPRRVGTAGCDPGDGGAAAATFFCRARLASRPDTSLTLPLLSGGPGRVKVEITLDPTPGGTPVEVLVAHELGHALGIGRHSVEPEDLMHAAPTVSRPSERDARTLRWLLHLVPDLRL